MISIVLDGMGSQNGVYITMDGGDLRIDDKQEGAMGLFDDLSDIVSDAAKIVTKPLEIITKPAKTVVKGVKEIVEDVTDSITGE